MKTIESQIKNEAFLKLEQAFLPFSAQNLGRQQSEGRFSDSWTDSEAYYVIGFSLIPMCKLINMHELMYKSRNDYVTLLPLENEYQRMNSQKLQI